jgi:hypothetical protein
MGGQAAGDFQQEQTVPSKHLRPSPKPTQLSIQKLLEILLPGTKLPMHKVYN